MKGRSGLVSRCLTTHVTPLSRPVASGTTSCDQISQTTFPDGLRKKTVRSPPARAQVTPSTAPSEAASKHAAIGRHDWPRSSTFGKIILPPNGLAQARAGAASRTPSLVSRLAAWAGNERARMNTQADPETQQVLIFVRAACETAIHRLDAISPEQTELISRLRAICDLIETARR